jgi:glycolate oxidase iron-sulfur subunit
MGEAVSQEAGAGDPGRVVKDVDRAAAFGVFDAFHPPSAELIDDCVHCGFCLPTCPTYAIWGEEMDSPRGRIWLMKAGLEGEVAMDRVFVQHLDACLGCMACVTACPSGVQYDKLIEATRPQIERNFPRTRGERAFRGLIFWLFPHARRLRAAAALAWMYQRVGLGRLLRRHGLLERLPPELRALEALLPDDIRPGQLRRRVPERVAARGPTRMRVGMITGCVQSVFFGDVNAATARVLAMEGCEVVAPRAQACCGALMVHAGRDQPARDHARRMIEVFEDADVDAVVINAAGCGSTLKEYGDLLRDDPDWAGRAAAFSGKVKDVMELLDELEPRAERHPLPARVAYHDACHLAHAQRVRTQPRRQLASVPGLEVLDIPEPEICCGSAGVYNLVEPEAAEQLGERKAANVASTDPDVIATGNPGCLLQIGRFLDRDVPLVHPVQLLDASLRQLHPVGARRRELRPAARGDRGRPTGRDREAAHAQPGQRSHHGDRIDQETSGSTQE